MQKIIKRLFISILIKKLGIIFQFCFSVKSNSNTSLISELGKLGSGADVVSEGELLKALKAKIRPNKIVFSGIGKTKNELQLAIKKNILF